MLLMPGIDKQSLRQELGQWLQLIVRDFFHTNLFL
jgi:hypothetical protein